AVERGWRTFVFGSEPFSKELVQDWSSTALIHPLFVDGAKLLDEQGLNVGMFYGVSSPRELELIRPDDMEVDNLVINFQGEWQVIPAENIVAAFQGFNRTVLAVATTSTEAQVFLEALEQGLDGVVLKVEDTGEILKLKGPVHAYLAVPGGKTCYLSELRAGKEVTVVDQSGLWRTAIVGRVKIESRPLVLVEAKENLGEETYSIFLQNAETVGLVCPSEEGNNTSMVIPVTSLKVGDEILVRKQGGARHTGIEIREFILEK
ncbi:3-dehydroquinate synthase, partial [Ananas comosus]